MTGITVLGPVAVGDEGASLSPRDRVVLSVLVARRGREVSADTIAEALWGEDLPPSAHKVVQGCVARLRRRLGHDAIVTGRAGYRLVVPSEDVDAGRFERLVQRARELLALDQADQAAYAADEALRLWRGHPLADLEDWEPGRGEAERLVELRLQAEELRLRALLASGRHAEVLPGATLLVQEQPLREHRWALLARAQYQDGRQAEALATLRRARQTLADELGLDPGAELVGLEQAVLAQDPALARPAAGVPSAACPWPGLAAYDVDDSDTFFGREPELAECLDRLGRGGFLAVVGPSGSGKSSLVRAGLAARLRREGRPVRIITPGPRPLDALADAVADSARGLVLVVDQCEEIFAPTVPLQVRTSFLGGVAEAAKGEGTQVLLTLRADRMGELAAYPAVARLVEDGLYLLKGIGVEGLREAIEQPARRAGLLLEHGLVDLLVRDVEGEPGSLPLLAHALRQTWERREGSTLTVQGYHASGGISGAVARSAEHVYEQATQEQRHALRELFLRMVQPGPGGEPVRTSVHRDVVADKEHAALVEQLVRARLVTAEADRLEIAHEALARAWPRLQSWLADDVQGERIRHHLAAAAQAWHAMGQPDSELYRGARLAAALEWRDSGTHRLTRVESDFLDASESAHRSELAHAQEEARRQRRLNQRLRLLVTGAVVLALVAALGGAVAGGQWREARAARNTAVTNAAQARSHQLAAAAVAVVEEDPSLAKALAVLSADEAVPPGLRSTDALHRALVGDRVVSRTSMNRHPDRLWAVLHPEGDRVAMTAEHVYQPGVALEVRDARTGHLVWEWVRPEEPGYGSVVVAGAQYSADGSLLAGGVLWDPHGPLRLGPPADQTPRPPDGVIGVHLWDARTHAPVQVLDVGPCGGWPVAVAGDKLLVRTLAARPSDRLEGDEQDRFLRECRWADGAMATVLVDRATGRTHQVSLTESLNLHLTLGHALTDDGSLAVVPDFATWGAVLVDGRTGRERGRLDNAVAFDFDVSGSRLLTIDVAPAGNDTWRIVSVPDLETETVYTGRSSWSYYGRFSSDDTTVWTTGEEGTLVQWDAGSGKHLRSLPGVGSGAPTNVGTTVLVPRPETGGAVLLDTAPPGDLWSVPSCGGSVGTDGLRVTDGLVVLGRDCGGARTGRLETLTHTGEPVNDWDGVNFESFEVSPDGRLVVTRDGAADQDPDRPRVGPLRVRELETGRPTVTLEGFCPHAALTSLDSVRAGDPAAEGCEAFPQRPFRFVTGPVAWSPDGRWIAAASEGVAVWDARTGDLVATVGYPGSPEYAAWSWPWDLHFSPDSGRLLMTTQNRYVVALDVATWEPAHQRRLETQAAHSAGLVGFDGNGSVVVVAPLGQLAANPVIMVLDPRTLEVQQVWTGVAKGSVQAAALSPDGTRIALANSEGLVTVWDLARRARVDQANPGLGRLDGVRWLDDEHLVVVSATGHVTTVSTDAAEVLELARASVMRGLTQLECTSYDVNPCPSMAQLRGSGPVVPEELRGTYELTWAPEELAGVAVRWGEESFGDLDQVSVDRLTEQAELVAGTYRLQLREADYTMTRRDTGEVWCTGSVTHGQAGPDRLLLGADSGERCTDFHYAEIGWDVSGDQLVLPGEEFRGADIDRLLWTGKPLERVG